MSYGDHPDQVANLHLPAGEGGPWPVVVVVHGGFWRRRWDRTTTTPLARELALRGLLAWNIEYRRVGQDGGGWPGTLLDVAAAVDHVTEVSGADPGRVVAVGHSAGGHLALWLAARPRLSAGSPGAGPRVRLRGAVSLAGVCDLVRGAEDGLGGGAVAELLGGEPHEQPDRYAAASPAALLPLGVPQVLVIGEHEDFVPRPFVEAYAHAAGRAGDDVRVDIVPGAGHFELASPRTSAWPVVEAAIRSLLDGRLPER